MKTRKRYSADLKAKVALEANVPAQPPLIGTGQAAVSSQQQQRLLARRVVVAAPKAPEQFHATPLGPA